MECKREWFRGYAAGLRNETDRFARLAAGPTADQFIAGWSAGLRDRHCPVRVPNPYVEGEEWTPSPGALFLTLARWDVVDALRRERYPVRGVSSRAPGLGFVQVGPEASPWLEHLVRGAGADLRYSRESKGFFLFLEDDGPGLPPEDRP